MMDRIGYITSWLSVAISWPEVCRPFERIGSDVESGRPRRFSGGPYASTCQFEALKYLSFPGRMSGKSFKMTPTLANVK